jgi:adenine deaminase
MKHLIDVAKGDLPADILLKNARMVNVFTGEVYGTNVALAGDRIAGVGEDYREGHEILDLDGLFLLPGFISGHLHLESTLLHPAEYTRLALPRGTTTVISDPHEIANVSGLAGIQAFMEATRDLPLDFFFMVPSCVPATDLETAGASLSAGDVTKLLQHERVLGLGEMMNFSGVVRKDPRVLEKIRVARKKGKQVDGHAPLLSGKALNAYIAPGIDSDHECTNRKELEEKLRLGMWGMIREGTAAKNLRDLLPAVSPKNSRRCLFVLDDLDPGTLFHQGDMDHVLRRAVSLGLDPATAVQMVTLNPAERFGLRDRGAISPGRVADLAVVEDLKNFQVHITFKSGVVAAREGKAYPLLRNEFDPKISRTVKIKPVDASSFRLPLASEKAWVIGVIPDQLLTRKLSLPVKKNSQGEAVSDPAADVLKIAVLERHRASGNIGLGLVQGFGFKKGAVGSTIAHDSHNAVIVGTNDADMMKAADEIIKMQGGLVVVDGQEVKAALPLPLAGLISLEPAETVVSRMEALHKATQEIGSPLPHPFLTLSFLALPVIPELKLTDKGLVDVSQFRIIPIESS